MIITRTEDISGERFIQSGLRQKSPHPNSLPQWRYFENATAGEGLGVRALLSQAYVDNALAPDTMWGRRTTWRRF